MKWLQNRRLANAFGFAACVGLLAYALFAEKILGYDPCPLCMFQRVGVAILAVVFLIAAWHAPQAPGASRCYALLIVLAAAFPAYVAGRHVYIQSLPPGSVPSCGATLDYMLEVFPLLEVVKKVLTGGGECAQIDWRFLGLSMPWWVLISMLTLLIYGVVINSRAKRRD